MNPIRLRRRALGSLLGVTSHETYHGLLLREMVDPYLADAKRAGRAPGRVLALGATHVEARALAALPFDEVVLSGIQEPDAALDALCTPSSRIRYELANAEALPYRSESFDLVIAKEVLHHLARPALGFYEMLRVCGQRAVFVEPWSCTLVSALERLGLTTRFETSQVGNLRTRDNHVFRWNPSMLEGLLASYYLESGVRCDVRVGWLSNRILAGRSPWTRRALLAIGCVASWIPGASGNLATVAIDPGSDLPPRAALQREVSQS